MRARCYVKDIQKLNKESDECMRQISLLGETQHKLTNKNIIDTLDDAIDELFELNSAINTQADHLVGNLTQLDDPIEAMVLIYRYHRGYCWEDIAYRLNIPNNEIKKVHGNALRSLDALLEEFEEDAEEE